jgi:hypothetical protein
MCGCMPQSNNASRPVKAYQQLPAVEYVPIEDTYISTRQFRAKLNKAKGVKSEPYSY